MNGEHVETFSPVTVPTTTHADTWVPSTTGTGSTLPRGTNTYRLEDIAYTRSGDKGNNCNIGNHHIYSLPLICYDVLTR